MSEGLGETLVLAVGNTLMGDDGAGQAMLAALQDYAFSPEVRLVDGGTQGLYLLPCLEGAKNLLLLDATDAAPGEVGLWQGEEVPRRLRAKKLSAHDVLLDEVLAVAVLLGQLPQGLALVGIGMKQLELGEGLSPEVEASLPQAVRFALGVLEQWGIKTKGKKEACALASPCG